jgi:hypothetical protein
VAADPSNRAIAGKILDAWNRRLASGEAAIPMGDDQSVSVDEQRALVVRAKAAMAAGVFRIDDSEAALSSTKQAAARSVPQVAPAEIDGWDPNSFPVDPGPSTDRRYCEYLRPWYKLYRITSGSSAQLTDEVSSRIQVTPYANLTNFSSTTVYSPYSGNLGEQHFRLWAITPGGHIQGQGDTKSLNGSHIDVLNNVPALRGKRFTSAVTLWVYVKPFKEYQSGGSKTADAACASNSNSCKYV